MVVLLFAVDESEAVGMLALRGAIKAVARDMREIEDFIVRVWTEGVSGWYRIQRYSIKALRSKYIKIPWSAPGV